MEQSFLWYDLETFGTNPFHDRIAQFAAVRTNLHFETVGQPIVLYCKPSNDYLPDPEACQITGISPLVCREQGICEYEFAREIFEVMMVPATTVVGYNSMQFDDEFIRNLFYRNFFDPYLREYADDNSRWDIINLCRATRDLRPAGMHWPVSDAGKPLFQLSALTAANNIDHGRAHDALSDIFATIGLANLIHKAQPRLFHWAFSHRTKREVCKLIDLNQPLIHSSSLLSREEGCSSLIHPLSSSDESFQNTLLCADLRYNPQDILHLSAEEIRQRVFLPSAQENETQKRFPIHRIRINRAPFLSPLSTLGSKEAEKLGININSCLKHRKILLEHPDFIVKLRAAFSDPPETQPSINSARPQPSSDPDYQIYSGFFSPADRHRFTLLQQYLDSIVATASHERKNYLSSVIMPAIHKINFSEEEKIGTLIDRLLGRNFGSYLSGDAARNWRQFCRERILSPLPENAMSIQSFQAKLSAMQNKEVPNQNAEQHPEQHDLLSELLAYFDELKMQL